MKFIGYLFIYSILVIGAWSCKSTKNLNDKDVAEVKQNEQTVQRADRMVFASIQRTACYGRCPIYKAVIYTSGTVIYEGEMNVEKLGIYEAKISLEDMKSIADRAKAIGYFDFKDKYDGNITDLPACYTSVRNGENVKEIYNRYQGPDSLKEFQKFMDQILDSLEWKLIQVARPDSQDDSD